MCSKGGHIGDVDQCGVKGGHIGDVVECVVRVDISVMWINVG